MNTAHMYRKKTSKGAKCSKNSSSAMGHSMIVDITGYSELSISPRFALHQNDNAVRECNVRKRACCGINLPSAELPSAEVRAQNKF